MSSKVDAVASVQSAVTTKGVAKNIWSVVQSLNVAIKSMEIQRICAVMDKFEQQFEDIDIRTSVMEESMGSVATTNTPADQVDELIREVADEAGLEVSEQLASVPTSAVGELSQASTVADVDALSRRLA